MRPRIHSTTSRLACLHVAPKANYIGIKKNVSDPSILGKTNYFGRKTNVSDPIILGKANYFGIRTNVSDPIILGKAVAKLFFDGKPMGNGRGPAKLVQRRLCTRKYIQICPNVFKYVHSNLSKYVQIYPNIFKYVQIYPNQNLQRAARNLCVGMDGWVKRFSAKYWPKVPDLTRA